METSTQEGSPVPKLVVEKGITRPKDKPILTDLLNIAGKSHADITALQFAEDLDNIDPLKDFRDRFNIPLNRDYAFVSPDLVSPEDPSIYLCGNSLGLPCKGSLTMLEKVSLQWAHTGVYVQFEGSFCGVNCDSECEKLLAPILGALEEEVSVMNSLTVNLHIAMTRFYRPFGPRIKIVIEEHSFPSDAYMARSQLLFHGISAANLVELKPDPHTQLLTTQIILDYLLDHGDEVAVLLLPGVQYYTGQCLDMELITSIAHERGIVIGWDLAHAVGNVPLKLHDWGVDFACWCSYKYLNSGPGGVGGMFIHEKHFTREDRSLKGWWGNKLSTRFQMSSVMDPSPGASCMKISTPPIHLMAIHFASLTVIRDAGMENIFKKQRLLTGYLEALINSTSQNLPQPKGCINILTPSNPQERGCQLSLQFNFPVRALHALLEKRGIICDVREPSVIRIAPVPLYNTFKDVHRFVFHLEQCLMCIINQNDTKDI